MPLSPQLLADIVVPENFTPYVQQLTEEKSRLVQSGVLARSPLLDDFLAGGGLTVNVPSWQDLDSSDANGADRVAGGLGSNHFSLNAGAVGAGTGDPVPQKIQRSLETVARMNRNNSWTSMDLAAALAGEDPMDAIAGRVSDYWVRRLQRAFVATWNGVIARNSGANQPGDAQVQNDLQNNVAGTTFADGVTNFTAEAFLDAAVTMGDSMEDLTAVMVHSIVYNRMQKNNLIDFIPDARGEVDIPTFLGRMVIVDDGMPVGTGANANVYDTWLFGGGTSMLGMGAPKEATETDRLPGAANGAGQEVLYSRTQWAIHPVGHRYAQGSIPEGGPANTDLASGTNWAHAYPERKQIKFARLVTREA